MTTDGLEDVKTPADLERLLEEKREEIERNAERIEAALRLRELEKHARAQTLR